jgi:hypothetical protein
MAYLTQIFPVFSNKKLTSEGRELQSSLFGVYLVIVDHIVLLCIVVGIARRIRKVMCWLLWFRRFFLLLPETEQTAFSFAEKVSDCKCVEVGIFGVEKFEKWVLGLKSCKKRNFLDLKNRFL